MAELKVIRKQGRPKKERFDVNEESAPKEVQTFTEKRTQTSADKIAKSRLYVRNWQWPGAREDFPHEPGMRAVDKYYPYAAGGPLLVDEPTTARDLDDAKRRAKFVQKRGYRYVYLTRDMDEHDAMLVLKGVN